MTKIKFGTDGWRAIIAQDFTTDNVARVAEATAKWILSREDSHSAVIGHDCRFGGSLFADVAAKVLANHGVKVFLADNFVSTPMISLGAAKLRASAGIVITASHNPPSYNGFKLKDGYGGPALPASIEEVESLIPEQVAIPETTLGEFIDRGLIEMVDLEEMYFKAIYQSFDLDAIKNSGIGLAYDAMFGAGQNIMQRILPEATFLHCEINPSFKGTAPEPLHKNLGELSKLIRQSSGLDLGLATDGDADRLGMYNAEGEFIDAHHIILLLVHYLHKYKGLSGKVVVAFSVTEKIKKLCAHYKIPIEITKVGFKHITGHMISEDVLLGGEESGGIAIKGHIPERDGIWDGLTLLEFMAKSGKSIDELVKEVYEIVGPFSYNRSDLRLEEEQKGRVIENCRNGVYTAFGSFNVLEVSDIDGYKFLLENENWVMIRPSGTEPLLRVYAEGRTDEEVKELLKAAERTLLDKVML